jgi:hypothetical protein
MSKDFEDQLRAAMRRVDPEPDFARRVMARVQSEPRRSLATRLRWPMAALAASVLFGVVVVHEWQVQREREGLEARKQLIEALRVTGEKLDLAYRVVNSESQPPAEDGSGA